jgi:hypothetical protein
MLEKGFKYLEIWENEINNTKNIQQLLLDKLNNI